MDFPSHEALPSHCMPFNYKNDDSFFFTCQKRQKWKITSYVCNQMYTYLSVLAIVHIIFKFQSC